MELLPSLTHCFMSHKGPHLEARPIPFQMTRIWPVLGNHGRFQACGEPSDIAYNFICMCTAVLLLVGEEDKFLSLIRFSKRLCDPPSSKCPGPLHRPQSHNILACLNQFIISSVYSSEHRSSYKMFIRVRNQIRQILLRNNYAEPFNHSP